MERKKLLNLLAHSLSLTQGLNSKRDSKRVKFEWSDKCQNSFEQLKEMLVEAPVVMQTTSGKEYTLYSDASGMGLGCVLMKDGK